MKRFIEIDFFASGWPRDKKTEKAIVDIDSLEIAFQDHKAFDGPNYLRTKSGVYLNPTNESFDRVYAVLKQNIQPT